MTLTLRTDCDNNNTTLTTDCDIKKIDYEAKKVGSIAPVKVLFQLGSTHVLIFSYFSTEPVVPQRGASSDYP